jgi:hypothetical protein
MNESNKENDELAIVIIENMEIPPVLFPFAFLVLTTIRKII